MKTVRHVARAQLATVGLFAIVAAAIALALGVRAGGDTGTFIDGARQLLDGHSLSGRQPAYAGYVTLIAACMYVGIGLFGIIVLQILLAVVAAWTAFRMALELGGYFAAIVGTLLLACDLETSRWHSFILSDSLFASLLVLSVWAVHRASEPRYGRWQRIMVALILVLSAGLLRPEGWLLAPVACAYWVARQNTRGDRIRAIVAFLAICGTVALVVAPVLKGNVDAVSPGELLRRGQTLWDYDGWRVSMPGLPAAGGTGILEYILKHPVAVMELMAARVAVHLLHVRPFYSTAHNAIILVWLLPIYAFATTGFMALRRSALANLCAAVIATQTLVVAATHADWDGRYLAHMLALIYPFAGRGIAVAVIHDSDLRETACQYAAETEVTSKSEADL